MPNYPKIVIPLNAGEPGWIRGEKMLTNEDEFKLDDPFQAALLLMLGLARREDLGALHIKLEDVERENDGWLKFTSDRFDGPLMGLKIFLETHMEFQIKEHPDHQETLKFPLLQNQDRQWRLAWAPETVCFSPLAFRGALRLGEIQKGKRRGALTIEMNVIENDSVKFIPNLLLVNAPVPGAVTEALFFMNHNLEEMPEFAALGDDIMDFCEDAYQILEGKDPAEKENLPRLLYQYSPKENLTEEDRARLKNAPDKIQELSEAHIVTQKAKISTIAFSVEGFLTRYITSIEDIEALLVAKLSTNARDQIAWQKRGTVEKIEKDFNNLQQAQEKVREKFRENLRKAKAIDLSAKGCLDFFSNTGLLYYLIDFRIYDNKMCILPFHTERIRDHVISLASYRVLKSVVLTRTDAVVKKDDDETIGDDVSILQIEGEDEDLWSEMEEGVVCFRNLLEEEHPLPEKARLVIHPGGQRVWGVAVVRTGGGRSGR